MEIINLTSNLKLQKPTSDERYSVQIQNTNMDILDSSIKALQDKDATLTKQTDFTSHTSNKNNPHGVTKEQLGLSNLVNQRQIPAIQSTVTDGGIPVFDGNGYTLKDSGFTIRKSVPENAEFTDTLYVHPENGVNVGEYTRVSVDSNGHVTYGSNPTTLYEYGITDAASIDHSHTAEEIGADVIGSAASALSQAKEYIDLKVAGQHGENVLKKQIVESLPIEDIDINTIYLVLKSDANGNDNYNEYINLDGTANGYEWIGNTNIDLADYYNKAESNNLFLLKANIANNLTTTDGGKALDARQGKILYDKSTNRGNYTGDLNEIPFEPNILTAYRASDRCTNKPTLGFGLVETIYIDSPAYAIQRFTSLTYNTLWMRTKMSGIWSTWASPSNDIDDLNRKLTVSATLSIESTYVPFVLRKWGNIVEILITRNSVALTDGVSYLIGNTPAGYMPSSAVAQMIPVGTAGKVGYFTIASNGEVRLRPFTNLAENEYIYTRAVYTCRN